MEKLYFVLRPSVSKLGLSVGLFILLSAVLSHYFMGIFFGLSMLLTLMLLYVCREKNPLQELAQLDKSLWTLKFKNGQTQHVTVLHLQRFGFCIFIKYQDDMNKKHSVCITKDQVDLAAWQKLQTFVELF